MLKNLVVLVFTLLIFNLQAKTVLKITMPDTLKIGKQNLVLNGMGIRKAKVLFLRIKVYVGGLYLSKKSSKANEVLSLAGNKFINMHFVRDVGKGKLIGGWKDAFNNAVKDQSKIDTRISRFNKMMGDIKENQEIKITFLKDKVNVNFNGVNKGDIDGADFAKALLSVWFINASDQDLRDGLLGL